MMNMNHDELATGVNGRLRPRKPSIALAQTNKIIRKSERNIESKTKNSALKDINLNDESEDKPCQRFLCLYCNKKFFLRQSLSQHLRRIHFSTTEQDLAFDCSFCNHKESGNIAGNAIIKHMIDCHPNQYFACHVCNTRFSSASELASHKPTSCENLNIISVKSYQRKLHTKNTASSKKERKPNNDNVRNDVSPNGTGFSGIVISCELKPSQEKDTADIENNITTNLILPPCKNFADNPLLDKNAIILLDDIQWSKSIGSHFSFHNADTEQILSRLGVVHRSPKTNESTKRDWYRIIDETTRFEKCFDTGFYSRVASNVQENLTKFLDGSFTRLPSDPDNVMKTRKAKNNVAINTVEGFPILLAPEQYSRIPIDSYMPRAIAPKHKWKWDNLENENMKNVLNQDREKRDSHANNCIVTLVSSLDIWTQLSMRRKYEAKFNKASVENKKIEKQNTISNELKEIIESREIPSMSTQVVKYTSRPLQSGNKLDFPASLGLLPTAPKYDVQPAILSGEWARPRCYVCCACGEQTRDTKALSSHISIRHPNAQITHYEIVGEPLLNADISKHLYVPPSQVFNRIRPLRGSKECTKCKKPVSFDELHQHMLECAGDTPVVRRRCRYRPFGVRRRRPRLPDNRIRKRIRKDIRNRHNNQKSLMKPSNKLRAEVGDAETIRKMLADLPAKRHRVTINPIDPVMRSRKIHEKRQLLLRRRVTEDLKNKKSTMKLSGNAQSNKTDEDHVNDNSAQMHKKGIPLQASLQKVLPSKRQAILKRTIKETCAQQPINENQLMLNPETPGNDSKQIETCCASNGIIIEDLSLNNKSDKICFNNGGDNARECSNRDNGNYRDDRQSRSNEPSRNNYPQNNGPTQNAPLKHSIARLTSIDESTPKYVKYPYVVPPENYITSIENIQYMPTGQAVFFENEIVANKLDKPPLCVSTRKSDMYGYQKNRLNKPKKGLNDCIAMLKNKLVDTKQNQHSSISSTLSSQKENVILGGFRTEFNGNEKDFGSASLLQTHAIPHAHTNVPSLISTPLDLSGKSENLDSTYGTSLDLSVKSTSSSNDMYVTLDLSTKNLSQGSTIPNKKIIDTNLESNINHISNDMSLNLSVKTIPKCNSSPNNNLIDLTENSTKMIMAVDTSVSKDVSDTINETKMIKNANTAKNMQKDVTPTFETFEKLSIDSDSKKSANDKRSSEKSASKQYLTKFHEKTSNQKPIYDPTLRIPQYKIRANTDSKNNDKETEKLEQKQATALEAGSCNIELLPKEIVDILGTMPVQHRNKLLNVLPQVFAKTVKQLKLAVDLNVTKETITSPNRSEIATQTSNNLSEQICPPEFVNVDTDKFLIDPVTGAIIERTNTENENSECVQNENITDLRTENKEEEVKQELPTLKIATDLCLDHIDPSANVLLATSGPIKQKAPNDQTASLRAVRIKSANEKLKSAKSDCIHTTPMNVEKSSFEDTNKPISRPIELQNNQKELNVRTTLAIQQFEVTSTQQNSCNYKQLSPTFVPDLQKSVSPVSGPILESSVVLDISNSDEDTNLHSNKDMNKVSSDSTLDKLQAISPNTKTIAQDKTDTEKSNQIVKIIVQSPSQNLSELEKTKALSFNETDQVHKISDAAIILKNIDVPLKNPTPKPSTPNSALKQNHNIGLSELDDDDPEDDVSLAIILKQKMANQEKKDSTKKIKFPFDDLITRKSVKKRKGKRKVKNVNSLEKTRNHTVAPLKKSKNQTAYVKSNILSNTENVSNPNEKIELSVDNNLIIADSQSDLRKRSNKKKSRVKAATNKINFDRTKEIDQSGVCNVTIEQSKLKLSVQENNEGFQLIKLSSESNENDKEDYDDSKVTISKKLREVESHQNKELTKKQPPLFNNSATHDSTANTLDDDNIICKKGMDENKIHYAERTVVTSLIKNNLHKVANFASDSRIVLNENEGTKVKFNSEIITNENLQLLHVNDDKIINSSLANTENDVSSTSTRNESQNTMALNYKFHKNKVRTQHTIEEIIKPRNLNQSLIHIQSDGHEQENQVINLSSMEVNIETKETDLPKESEIIDTEKNKSAVDKICVVSNLEETGDVPLRRSKRAKSFYAESYTSNFDEYPVSDNSCLQHKTPLTKKQVIFSKLLLDVENPFKPSIDICSKNDSDVSNEISNISSKTEIVQSLTKPIKRKMLPIAKKKIKKKKTIEEIVQARSNLMNSDTTVSVDYIVLPLKSNLSNTSDSPIITSENDKTCDLSLNDHNKISDNENNDLHSKTRSQDVLECQPFDHGFEKIEQQKSNKKNKQSKNDDTINEKGVENCPSLPLGITDEKPSTSNLNDNAIVLQEAMKNDHSQVTISVSRLSIGQSLSENNNKLIFRSEKRKSSKSEKLEPDETAKKSKMCKIESVTSNISSTQVQSNSENNPPNNNKYIAFDQSIAEELQLLEIQLSQRTRPKYRVVRSNSDVVYEDSYYDFFEDPKGEYSYSNDSTSSTCSESVDSGSNELDNANKTENKKSKKSKICKTTSGGNDESPKLDYNPLTNGKEDISSDSDDSIKSDVPLKKYAEEIAKCSGESCSKSAVSDPEKKNDDVKENKKDGKNKKSSEINDEENATNNADTEEELRSEQFMESFGFFSERKPRKSNLLATKKISETFHIISNESDDIFLPAKNKSNKKMNSSENTKKNKDIDPGNGKILKDKNKTPQPSTSKKPQKKRRKKRRRRNSATYCIFCRKDFERLDNYLRHRITLLHISRVSEIEMQFDTIPFADVPNHLVAYKHHIYKLKKKREKMARDKKKSGRDSPIEPFVFPTLDEIINKPGTSKSKANKGKTSKGKGKKSKPKKSEGSIIETNKSEANEAETDKSEAKEQERNELEADKPGCSSQDISRRGLSRDEALFLDCCELLKESHKTENINAETSHTVEEGKESFEVKSFECSSLLNNDEKSWGKNEDDIDPITARSILESEEVRNLENDLLCGLKEAVSNASSSLVSNSKASKEFVSNIHDTNEIAHFSKNPTVVYAKDKMNEVPCYSKKAEVAYSNEKINEIAHCSKDTKGMYSREEINEKAHCSKNMEVMYSNEKIDEIAHCSKSAKITYLKEKSNEFTNNFKNKEIVYLKEKLHKIVDCSKNADMHSKQKTDETPHFFKNEEVIYSKEKVNEIPHNSKNSDSLQEKTYETAHCSKNADIRHSKHKNKEIAHSYENAEIVYSKQKSNQNPNSSKNAKIRYSQEQSYEIAHCSKNTDIVHSKYITKEIAHCSKDTEITYSKEKINGNPHSSKHAEIIYSQEKSNEIAQCSKNMDSIHSKQKINDIAHCSGNTEIMYSKEKINGNPYSSKNKEITYLQEKSYEIAHCSKNIGILYSNQKWNENTFFSKNAEIMYSEGKNIKIPHSSKNADAVYSQEKVNEIGHCPENAEMMLCLKEKTNEVLHNSKNSKEICEIAHCSKNAEIVFSKEKNNEYVHSPKNTESLYSKERIKKIGHSSKNAESVYSKERIKEVGHSSKNIDSMYSKEKIKEVEHSSKNSESVYSKDRIKEIEHSSKNAEYVYSKEKIKEVRDSSKNVESVYSKEKKCESTHSSKNAKFIYSKEPINEIGQCSQHSEYMYLEEMNEASRNCKNTKPLCIKEKNHENVQGSKHLKSLYTNLNETTQNMDLKLSEQIKPNIIPETKLVDVFEDKFDIIKRKCRSQAAAAKNLERNLGIQNSNQAKKKSDKKTKSKKNPKKNVQNPIITKGALKEFGGIKVSIPTSEIKMTVFAPTFSDGDRPPKKKKKNNSKKKKEKSDSNFNIALSSSVPDHSKDNPGTAKQTVDVYEFMDNEDTDMFDFRSKRLDRFKNTNKDLGHCSKIDPAITKVYENSQHSSISGSDVDDFVYMSDDYVCSADETENSVLSCELGTVSKSSSEGKKNGSSIKRKDSTEKNAVMGKIFKHNAMRNERKNYSKAKETKCAKANLDQLFDSLLENEPNSPLILNENVGSQKEAPVHVNEILSLPAIDETTSEAGPCCDVPEEEESEAGVARQRARRKCTVGKQNVLAESWSSESEGDSGESDSAGHRRRPARPQGPSRRARRITFKVDENESRVCSNVSTSSGRRDKRSRSELAYYWSSADEEDTRVEQHGWIVGDSHKKLVTMLAHAKGRKRDDRRHFVE